MIYKIFRNIFKQKEETSKKLIYNVEKKVRDMAWKFLIDNQVSSFPLDLNKILNNNNWKYKSYLDYTKQHNLTINSLIDKSPDGFTEFNDTTKEYTIVVNFTENKGRNRFTIAHEIGHILLHPYFQGNDLEKEANMFAARILMPMCLIHECKLDTPEKISETCNVSLTAAYHRINRYHDIIKRDKLYSSPLERKLRDILMPFIHKYNTQKE